MEGNRWRNSSKICGWRGRLSFLFGYW